MTNLISNQMAWRLRSLQLPVVMLIALLQRTPVLRILVTAESVWVSSSLGQVLKASAAVVAAFGAVDTLAGATALTTNPADPAEATVGVPFSAAFAYSGGPTSVGSYSISNLPPGLTVPGSTAGANGSRTLNGSTGTITGTPTQAGMFAVSITAFDDPNLGAGTHGSAQGTYTIIVEANNVAPGISAQPQNVTVTAGQQASFSVTATGSPAPTFQWRKDGVNIGGATNSTFTIASTVTGDAGTYSVVATNASGSATSNGATLTVNPAPAAPQITTQPQSQSVTAGDPVTFTAAASGTPSPTFQWRKDGVNIGGATSSTFTINSTVTGDAGTYTVVATNASGSATSNGATLTVNAAPVAPQITTQPEGQVVTAGDPVTFTAAASGTPTPTFQWKKDGVNIGGATNSTYTIASTVGGDAGTYTVVATNGSGSATSNGATLTVNPAPAAPQITTQPQSQVVVASAPVTFIAAASGTPAPTYQWQKNGVNIGGATDSTYTIAMVTGNDAGNYRVVATNASGSATSDMALLSVIIAPADAIITITVE